MLYRTFLLAVPLRQDCPDPDPLQETWPTMDTEQYQASLLWMVVEGMHSVTSLTMGLDLVVVNMRNVRAQCSLQNSPAKRLCGLYLFTQPYTIDHNHNQHSLHQTFQWEITMLYGYNTDLQFAQFKIMYSTGCDINKLNIKKSGFQNESYCGVLPDWQESCPCSWVGIYLYLTRPELTTTLQISYGLLRQKAITIKLVRGSYKQSTLITAVLSFDHMFDFTQIIIAHIFAQFRKDLVHLHDRQLGRMNGETDLQRGKSWYFRKQNEETISSSL